MFLDREVILEVIIIDVRKDHVLVQAKKKNQDLVVVEVYFLKNESVESPRYHSRERRDDNRHDRVFCYIISMYNLVDHIS